jgi:hemoglobin
MFALRIGAAGASVLAALALSACKAKEAPPAPPAPPPSLYQRLGGQAAIEAVVKDFAGRALGDARINQKFARSNPDRVVSQLIEHVCASTGGPCTYTGRSMKMTHAGMGVTEGEFDALVEDLVASLDQFKVPATEQGELLAALGAMKGDIVEVPGAATGTPLPKNFVPSKQP